MLYGKKREEREKACHFEVCRCGHPRADHGDALQGTIKCIPSLCGHGVCMIEGCACDHYTWTPKTHAPSTK